MKSLLSKLSPLLIVVICLAFGMQACKKKIDAKQDTSVTLTDTKGAVDQGSPEKGSKVKVSIETNLGTVVAELDADKAPVTVKNFVDYASSGFYNGTIFHRVIDGFMIQGGGFESGMKEKTTKAPIVNEAKNGLKNEAYTLSMARTNDPNSASSQFFINLKDNAFLNMAPGNPGYAVFGKVVEGTEIVDKIGKVKTGSVGYFDDVPKEAVTIKSVKVL